MNEDTLVRWTLFVMKTAADFIITYESECYMYSGRLKSRKVIEILLDNLVLMKLITRDEMEEIANRIARNMRSEI